MKIKNLLVNSVKHFKTICIHKYWVFYYCNLCGITWRGIKHDMSKFSPTEFFESIKYYTGTSSPIDSCKKDKGYSKAWFHHRGRNDHHYEMWIDNFDNGGVALQMPYECSVEMLCDYLAAGRAYNKDKFTYVGEFLWYVNKINHPVKMHIGTKSFIYLILSDLAVAEDSGKLHRINDILSKMNLLHTYQIASKYTESDLNAVRHVFNCRKWGENNV